MKEKRIKTRTMEFNYLAPVPITGLVGWLLLFGFVTSETAFYVFIGGVAFSALLYSLGMTEYDVVYEEAEQSAGWQPPQTNE